MTLEQEIEHISQFVDKSFAANNYISPMWIGILPDGGRIAVATDADFNSSKEKDKASAAVRKLFKEKCAVQYVFISEAWVVMDAPPEALEAASRGGLKDHPDRREVVMIEAADKKNSRMGFRYILRPEHGAPSLSPLHLLPQMDKSEGRLVNMLSD